MIKDWPSLSHVKDTKCELIPACNKTQIFRKFHIHTRAYESKMNTSFNEVF